MILKKLKLFGLIAIVASATILGCKDDFTEEDFLKLQNDLAKEKEKRDSAYLAAMTREQAESFIAALNEVGDLMSITVLVRDDNTPVAGVSVSLTSGSASNESGRTKDIVTVVTDAAGRAVFERVTIGDNVISLSKTNYVSASARVDFGTPPTPLAITTTINGTTVTRYIAPPKRFENFALPLYSESSAEGNTAVIQGTFTIQSDLTNDPTAVDPIPTGIEVAANLGTALSNAGAITSSCNCVLDYRFSGGAGSLGVAAVNTTNGTFSMLVPATAAGLGISMIYPTIVGTQRIAVRRLNGVDITPEFRQVSVRWEPGVTPTANIPVIPGARAVFSYNGSSTPAPAGRGFTITNFTPVGRALGVGAFDQSGNTILSNTVYRINSRGYGFSSSPTVTITGGGGSGAQATSSLRSRITDVQLINGGSGYAASTTFDVQFVYINAAGATVVYGTTQNIQSNASGVLPNITLTLPNTFGFGQVPLTTPAGVQGFGIRVVDDGTSNVATSTTPATFVPTQFTELAAIQITNGGSNYTSTPTITIAGGGSLPGQTPLPSSASVVAHRVQFDFSLPTNAATTPYRVLPAGIQFIYPANAVDGQTIEANALIDLMNPIGIAEATGEDLIDHIITDGTNLQVHNAAVSFRTNRFWTAAPSVLVQDRTIQAAAVNLSVSATTGEVSFNDPTSDGASINDLIPVSANTITGQGYDAISVQVVPSITGAPGSGAVFNLTTTQDVNSRLVTWGGATTRLSAGSGYLANLNRTTSSQAYTGISNPITVQTGKVYNLTINAGTGVRLEAIEN